MVVYLVFELDVVAVLEDDAGWTAYGYFGEGGELVWGAVRSDIARGTHICALGTLLYQSAVVEDHARGSLEHDIGICSLVLDLSAVLEDGARGSIEITLDPVEVIGELEVAVLGHDARWSDEHDAVGKVVAELLEGAVLSDDARVANVSLGEDVSGAALPADYRVELDVVAVSGHDSGWSLKHEVAGLVMGKLSVYSVGAHDSGWAVDMAAVCQVLRDGLRCWWKGGVKFSLTMSQLEVLACAGHNAGRSAKNDAVGKVVCELDVIAIRTNDPRRPNLCIHADGEYTDSCL